MRRLSGQTRRLVAACAGSLALHALVVAAVMRISWDTVERERAPPVEVVWLADLPPPDPAAESREIEPPPEAEPPAESVPQAQFPALAPAPPPRAPAPPPPESAPPPPESAPPPPEPASPLTEPEPTLTEPEPTLTEPEPTLPEPEPTEEPGQAGVAPTAPTPGAPLPDPAADDAARGFVVTEADLEEAWRRAVEEAREQREREERYLTFSLDDLVDAPPPEEPGPSESIFEAAERFRGRGGPSVLSPTNARTRVGRAVAELCNALTGGFGVGLNGIGVATFCAEGGESAKLFAHIKPAYLRSRPVCTEVQTAAMAAEGVPPSIKCELVEADALAEQGGHELP